MSNQELSEKNEKSISSLRKEVDYNNKVIGKHVKKHLDFNAKMKKLFRHDLDKEFGKYNALLGDIGARMVLMEKRIAKIEEKEKK